MAQRRPTQHVAVDLGAESGRVMLGAVDPSGGSISLREVHRFPSVRTRVLESERWDVLGIFNEIVEGLKKAAEAATGEVTSVSVDSWAVDYVLLKAGHPHLTPPFMYRDARTDAVSARVQSDPAAAGLVFDETGIQFLPFNTIYQLLADLEQPGGKELHAVADGLLLVGDYFNFLLSGVRKLDRSMASTTQLYNPRTRRWSDMLCGQFGIRRALLPELVDSGTTLGPIRDDIAARTGLSRNVQVVATCSHDTAAAVAATPIREGGAYLSSGTWSLLGVELAEPVVTDACRAANFTNEVGFGHTIRLLKNISGLFIVQELRKEFAAAGQEADYATLAEAAREAEPLRSLIRPELPPFAKAGDVARKVADHCRETGQPVPETPGQFVRCVYDSLAMLYAETLGQIEAITGSRPTGINVVGGGGRAEVLNQATADACGVAVEAGPVEATALGNVGVHAIAAGTLGGLERPAEPRPPQFPARKPINPKTTAILAAAERFSFPRPEVKPQNLHREHRGRTR